MPTEDAAKIEGIGPAVTFLDSKRLQEGIGEMNVDAPMEFQTTPSGIQYRILRTSEWQKPTAMDSVKVHYRGWLDNGRVFDSHFDGKPVSFSLQRVVPGWTEGLQLIGVGGMIELWIPPKLGYGSRGQAGSIPPNAPLHFIVELKSVD
jgi:FKBP-type peptidyl-prolyl cis-trans isomerase FkpA